MLAEIRQQPDVLAVVASREEKRAAKIGAELRRRGARLAVFAARGSSDHAAALGRYWIEWAAGIPVGLAAPSIATLYKTDLELGGAAVVGVSQSGKSPDVVEYLKMARRGGAYTIGVTNDAASPLAGAAHETLLCHAGPERSVAATKTFTAQLACLAFLAAGWADNERGRKLSEGLKRAPGRLGKVLASRAPEALARKLSASARCVVLGRGFAYAAALEVALKLKESAGLASEGASAADFLHGPVASAGPGLVALLLAPSGPGLDTVRRTAAKLHEAGARVLALSEDAALLRSADFGADVSSGWLEPLAAFPLAVAGQLAAYRLALLKGLDPDRPAGLQKITQTW